ncbi:MAG: hypothetical protein ACREH6_12785 [Geminicoccaceae bacterium]
MRAFLEPSTAARPEGLAVARRRRLAGATPLDRLRLVIRVGMALDLLLGLALLLVPSGFGAEAREAALWARVSGILMLGGALFLLPAALWPLSSRFPIIVSTLVRALLGLALLLAGGALVLLALYEAGLCAAQTLLFWRAWLADLMAKP